MIVIPDPGMLSKLRVYEILLPFYVILWFFLYASSFVICFSVWWEAYWQQRTLNDYVLERCCVATVMDNYPIPYYYRRYMIHLQLCLNIRCDCIQVLLVCKKALISMKYIFDKPECDTDLGKNNH